MRVVTRSYVCVGMPGQLMSSKWVSSGVGCVVSRGENDYRLFALHYMHSTCIHVHVHVATRAAQLPNTATNKYFFLLVREFSRKVHISRRANIIVDISMNVCLYTSTGCCSLD